MAREAKIIEFAGKKISVREMKIKELNQMFEMIGTDIEKIISVNGVIDLKNSLIDILKDKLPLIFKEIKESDIEEAYPSEVEELITVFIEQNFFGLKKIFGFMLKLPQTF
ncbi:hypothetical protein [Caloramator sp. ALD01]|uniref:hypothetical protein n=1 Tax=Caloramator sp. ALD01 TaxID=1031288 RepID=UPI0003F5A919|nr:hypothetical protein [Caloramator sp. ALD01]